ncbi:hypothetical protein BT69DRAFT_199505 [Atractiella rhizophila]|nr:hypothetical protein BT69DRAFT_199505 [Atractiella rhizophila]
MSTPSIFDSPAVKQHYAFTVTVLKTDYDGGKGEVKLVGVTLSMEGAQDLAAKKMYKSRPSPTANWKTAKEGAVVASGKHTGQGEKYSEIERWMITDFNDTEVKKVVKRKRKKLDPDDSDMDYSPTPL